MTLKYIRPYFAMQSGQQIYTPVNFFTLSLAIHKYTTEL